MTKTQRLRNVADGFMAGLVANGFRGPWRWSNLDWELPFYQAWKVWAPARRAPQDFPKFEIGGHGASSQARELLWELKRTSPFHTYADVPLNVKPMGLEPVDFLEIWAKGATPDEWVTLARAFLENVERDS